jgi:hypothetical protein
MRRVAAIPREFQREGIAWLVMENDPENTGGVFLYLHAALDEPCKYDQWHLTAELAEAQASREWGVQSNSWRAG